MVPDAVAAAAKARELGGDVGEPVRSDSGWSVLGTDDQGGAFGLWQPAEKYAGEAPNPGLGDLHYFVVPTADDEAARAFYGALFGWEFEPGFVAHGWQITNSVPPGGLHGTDTPGALRVYFHVADIAAAVAAVEAAGGSAGEVQENGVGWHADCRDDQGLAFSLSSLRS